MARIYIAAGSYAKRDLTTVIDHDCADEAAVQELVKRLRQRGELTHEDEGRLRQLVCYERFSNRPPTFCPEDVHVKVIVSGREYKLYATAKPLRKNVRALSGGEDSIDEMLAEMPDMHIQAKTRTPEGSFDHVNGIEISAKYFSQPGWVGN